MRVAFIAGSYQPQNCGVADYTDRLRQSLSQQGLESIVFTTHRAAKIAADPAVRGVVADWRLQDLLPLVQAVRSTPADLLHIQHAAGSYGFQRSLFLLPPLLRASGYRQPIITTVHEYGWWEWQPNWLPKNLLEELKQWGQQRSWWDREDGFLLTGSRQIIFTNADAEQVLRQRLPQLSDRLHHIPIAANVEVAAHIDRSQSRQTLRQTFGWSEAAIVLAFFGFLHPVKGIETLLLSLQQVLTVHPQVRLLLIGGVESLALRGEDAKQYWQKLHDRVAALNLSSQVAFTGYVSPELASTYLSGADIGVLPFNHGVTLKSGSLLALLAHGLPVVATYADPPDPDLNDQHLLVLVPPRQPDPLAQALIELIPDAQRRDRCSQTGREFVKRFSWKTIARQHLDLYQNSVNLPGEA